MDLSGKFDKWCEDNGIDRLKKSVVEYSNVLWYALMDAVDLMQGNPLDKQTWNKVMQNYAAKKVEDDEITENRD